MVGLKYNSKEVQHMINEKHGRQGIEVVAANVP